jgi:ribosomal protein L11 methylase PrmA
MPVRIIRPEPIPGSYRDPCGQVFCFDGKIYRAVFTPALENVSFSKESGFLEEAQKRGLVVPTKEITNPELLACFPDAAILLEHETVPFISFPYEWTFSQLIKAALFHLDLHLLALKFGVTMRDSSAYNIQFCGASPVFIDYLSFERYEDGQLWAGHHQFCEQFLNPLLLFAKTGLEYQKWYRGALSGISTRDTARILPWKAGLSPQIFVHVFLKNRMEKSAATHFIPPQSGKVATYNKTSGRKQLPKQALVNMLSGLRSLIAGLKGHSQKTLWQDYAQVNSYDPESTLAKHKFVQDFCSRKTPNKILDVGCNTGEFSEIALSCGAKQAVGLDMDHGALSRALACVEDKSLALLPLLQDLQNLSPAQGWNGEERQSLSKRISKWKPDAVLALAIVHHLALSGNVPLAQILDWITGLAPTGVIEFVPKGDSTVQIMLRHREDIFPSYTQTVFESLLQEKAPIMTREVLPNGRVLYAFGR